MAEWDRPGRGAARLHFHFLAHRNEVCGGKIKGNGPGSNPGPGVEARWLGSARKCHAERGPSQHERNTVTVGET